MGLLEAILNYTELYDDKKCPGIEAIVNALAKLWKELNLADGTYKPE